MKGKGGALAERAVGHTQGKGSVFGREGSGTDSAKAVPYAGAAEAVLAVVLHGVLGLDPPARPATATPDERTSSTHGCTSSHTAADGSYKRSIMSYAGLV